MRVDEVWTGGELVSSVTYNGEEATFRRYAAGVLVEERPAHPDETTPDLGQTDTVDRYLAAESARRAAYDATIAGKSRSLALLDAATRAGSAAFSAYLEEHP